jgi:hypothetical protein
MEQIGNLIKGIQEAPKPTTGGINSPFNDVVAKVIDFMGDNEHPFGYWCGRLRDIPVCEIYSFMSLSREGKNPQALFNWNLKKYKGRQKALVIHRGTGHNK